MKKMVINGTLDKRFKKYSLGVQNIQPPVKPQTNVGQNASKLLGSTASMAATGAATGGVPGAIVGGIVGLASGLLGNRAEKKANEAEYEARMKDYRDSRMEYLQQQVLTPEMLAQQANQYMAGTNYLKGTKDIEVERDELIFQKSSTGKYILKADFYGGRTHNQGGEGYTAQEGDIIFPGKDRKKVLAAYSRQDYPKLESMRLRLPKDVNEKAQEGFDGTDPGDSIQYKKLLLKSLLGELSADEQAQLNGYLPKTQGVNSYVDSLKTQLDSQYGIHPEDDVRVAKKPVPLGTRDPQPFNSDNVVPIVNSINNNVDPRIASRVLTDIPTQGITDVGLNSVNTRYDLPSPSTLIDGATNGAIDGTTNGVDNNNFDYSKLTQGLGYAGQLASVIHNLFPGQAEVQNTPDVNLAKLQYQDTSAPLRRNIVANEKIQASNARNVAGGNIQNYLANRRLSGLNANQQMENISNSEYQKQLNIANQNVGIINQERLINAQNRKEDAQVNAANRSARRNSIRQGMAGLSEFAGTVARDSVANTNEDKLINALNQMGLYAYTDANGDIKFKPKQQENGNK